MNKLDRLFIFTTTVSGALLGSRLAIHIYQNFNTDDAVAVLGSCAFGTFAYMGADALITWKAQRSLKKDAT